MPSQSKKQHNFMAMIANNPKKAKQLKVPSSVGAEFLKADKGKKFKAGGEVKGPYAKEGAGPEYPRITKGSYIRRDAEGMKQNVEGLSTAYGKYKSSKDPSEAELTKRLSKSSQSAEDTLRKATRASDASSNAQERALSETYKEKAKAKSGEFNFKTGGEVKKKEGKMFSGSESVKEEVAEAKAIKAGKISPMQYAKKERAEPEREKGMKKGGKVKCMQAGGIAPVAAPQAVPVRQPVVVPQAAPVAVAPRVMKKGGSCHANGGSVTRADGVAQRGKTRGRFI